MPKFRIKFLFKVHSPANPKERARIEAAGGVVHRLDGDVDRVWATDPEQDHYGGSSGTGSEDDDREDEEDEHDYGNGGDAATYGAADGGLAMSRSLGDEVRVAVCSCSLITD